MQQQDPSRRSSPCRAVPRALQKSHQCWLGALHANPRVHVLSRRPPWQAVACDHAHYFCTAGRDAIKASAGGMQTVCAPTGASCVSILHAFVRSKMHTVDRSSVASRGPPGHASAEMAVAGREARASVGSPDSAGQARRVPQGLGTCIRPLCHWHSLPETAVQS